MADGSHLSFEENISYTKFISQLAHSKDMLVEAELGRLSGTEDDLTVEEYKAKLTDVNQVHFCSTRVMLYSCIFIWIIKIVMIYMLNPQAEDFIDRTGIDALAVCIGNVHGKYPPSGPNLRLDLLEVYDILVLQYTLV